MLFPHHFYALTTGLFHCKIYFAIVYSHVFKLYFSATSAGEDLAATTKELGNRSTTALNTSRFNSAVQEKESKKETQKFLEHLGGLLDSVAVQKDRVSRKVLKDISYYVMNKADELVV